MLRFLIIALLVFAAPPTFSSTAQKIPPQGHASNPYVQISGKTVGYYMGSFDPPHLGHLEVAGQALKVCDFVLIYPMPGGDPFKDRKPFAQRVAMWQAMAKDAPRIIVIPQKPIEFQRFIKQLSPQPNFLGVMGADAVLKNFFPAGGIQPGSVQEKKARVYYQGFDLSSERYTRHATTSGGVLIAVKTDQLLVVARAGSDVEHLQTGSVIYGDRRIAALLQSTNQQTISSTKVRQAIAVGDDDALEGLLHPDVIPLAKVLYGQTPCEEAK